MTPITLKEQYQARIREALLRIRKSLVDRWNINYIDSYLRCIDPTQAYRDEGSTPLPILSVGPSGRTHSPHKILALFADVQAIIRMYWKFVRSDCEGNLQDSVPQLEDYSKLGFGAFELHGSEREGFYLARPFKETTFEDPDIQKEQNDAEGPEDLPEMPKLGRSEDTDLQLRP